jgi:hypothetical protein
MGLFGGGKPKTPQGMKHMSSGEDKVSTWSLRRLESELSRIKRAKSFNSTHGKAIGEARRNIQNYYKPQKGKTKNFGGIGGVGNFRHPTGFGGIQFGTQGSSSSPFSGESPGHGFGGYGSYNVENYRRQYHNLKESSEQLNNVGNIFGSNAGGGHINDPLYNFKAQGDLFAAYDSAVEAAQGDADAIRRNQQQAQSGLGLTGVGDEFWVSRLESALAQKKAQFAGFRSERNTPKRVSQDAIDAKSENEQRTQRAGAARGGGGPGRQGPLTTTSPGVTGVL